jgi:mRNA interferase MazF
MAGRVTRGEIRLVTFPKPDKARPALVLTRDSALRYLTRVTIAPITSTVRGVPSEVPLGPDDGMKAVCAINLHNVITIDQKVLGRRIAQLSEARMREVCSGLAFALGCD